SPSCVIKAVFSWSFSSIFICQYPLLQSNVVNHWAPVIESKMSFINGNGYSSLLVTAFNFLKSTHNRNFPFFFLTTTTGDVHALLDSTAIPACTISSTSSSINLLFTGSCLYAFCLIGNAHVVGIVCVYPFIRPNWSRFSANLSPWS